MTGGEIVLRGDDDEGFSGDRSGPLALPGKYTVALEKRDEQGTTELVPPTAFEVEPLNFATLPPPDREAVMAFARQTGELQRAALGTLEALNHRLEPGCQHQADHRPDADLTPRAAPGCAQPGVEAAGPARAVHRRSDKKPAQRAAQVGLIDRIEIIIGGHWSTTSAPTGSHRKNYEIAAAEFEAALKNLHPLLDRDLPALHETLEAAGAPWAPGGSCRSGSGEPNS